VRAGGMRRAAILLFGVTQCNCTSSAGERPVAGRSHRYA